MQLLIAGTRGFNNYPLFKDFVSHYCQNYKDITIITDGLDPYKSLIKDYVAETNYHLMTLTPDWANNRKQAGYLNWKYLPLQATHAVLFWDGWSDFKLLQYCNQAMLDYRVLIYEPKLEASSQAFI